MIILISDKVKFKTESNVRDLKKGTFYRDKRRNLSGRHKHS